MHVIADDIIIANKDEAEHDQALHQVTKQARQANAKFSLDKLQLKIPQAKYMGHLISHEGIRPDPYKVNAVTQMPKPDDRKGIERLFGMVKYLSSFIPHESDVTAPLRNLLKDTPWKWQPEHAATLQRIKESLTSNPVLAFYDVKKPVKIQTDPSSTGLGACLLQEGKPLAYASRTLTSAEKSYAQIEKEMLDITYACRKFHAYMYGKVVTVETDHRDNHAKTLSVAPPMLQRMLLQTQRYQLEVQYVPGKEVLVADVLSRAHLPTTQDTDHDMLDDCDVMIHSFLSSLPCSAVGEAQIQCATKQDSSLQDLSRIVQSGWPKEISKAPDRATLQLGSQYDAGLGIKAASKAPL